VLSAAVILITGWHGADALVSLGISVLIAAGAVTLLREAFHILAEATPKDVDSEAVRRVFARTSGIEDVHDLHIWSLDRGHRALSAHVTVADRPLVEVTALLRQLETLLCEEFGIEHATLQPECPSCTAEAPLYCDIDARHEVMHASTPNDL
jgi:cobalt-zinc-cadmium efflux system protein